MNHRFWTSTALAGVICVFAQSASAQIWEDISQTNFEKTQTASEASASMSWARTLKTNMSDLEFVLNQAPHERLGASNTTIDLPLPDGGVATFALTYSPIVAEGSMGERSDIQTFHVVDVTNSANVGRLDMTFRGFHGMFIHNGERVFIDPAASTDSYYSYYDSDYVVKEGRDASDRIKCDTEGHSDDDHFTSSRRKSSGINTAQKTSFGTDLRRYRIAVAATGEYTQYFGGTKEDGLAGIVTAINRLNVIFESEMAVRLELVANNESVIFTDPVTDPFTHSDRSTLLGEVGSVLDTEIGDANYDVGHVFGVFGGGIARLGAVCSSGKARGVSGTSRPDRSSFITLFAHEVGHQFNAPHSFNGSTSNCKDNRSGSSAVEPHSGSTIMSYAGICGSENLRGGKDTFFHNSSLTFMNDFVENSNRGGRCAVLTPLSNTAPIVEAGEDGAIPALTPFTLTGQASDADGDDLTHIWEQLDIGPANDGPGDFVDDGQRPLFRSFQPSPTPSRTFPQLAQVLSGDILMGEVLPTEDRDLTFRMTARDGKGGVTDDERILRVSAAAGPFIVETPTELSLPGAMPYTVTWDVANTTADPINCAAVSLSLSTDGGNSFSYPLIENTENDGSATVEIPNVATSSARLKASCATQPFFAVNDANFEITFSIIVNEAPVAVTDPVSVEEDSLRIEINVLANDSDPEGDTLTLVNVGALSAGGEAEISGDVVIYSPEPGFVGTETFEYAVEDGNDNTSTGVVTVTVTAKPNITPETTDDSLTVDQDSSATRIDVLSNDSDADGDTLSVQSVGTPSNGGSVQINGTQIDYTPAQGFSGTETFTYVVSDGQGGTATGTVTVTVTATPPPPTQASPPLATPLSSGGGGGSFGPFLLLLMAIKTGLARRREKRCAEITL